MADIKISDLTLATSASGAQELEINDSGASKKVTVDQIKTYVTPDGGVTTAKLADDAVTTAKIAPGAVNTSDIADAAVTALKIAAATITPAKIVGTPTGLVKADNGAGTFSAATAGTDFVAPGAATNFTATQRADYTNSATVSATGTYNFDGSDQIRLITLTNAATITFGAPVGIVEGAYYTFLLKAGDTSVRTFAWNSAYKFPGTIASITSGTTNSGAFDVITFVGGASDTMIYVGHQADLR